MKLFRLKDNDYTNEKFNGGALRLVALVLACFAISPMAQAVSPAPDGGYPGGNTAEGQNALFSRTTGGFNTAVGYFSLRSDTTNSFNTAIGAGALFANTADDNTATGAGALLSNTTGAGNTANGAFALSSNTTGNSNTANGVAALVNNTTGSFNIALGNIAGSELGTGNGNIDIGNIGGSTDAETIRIGDIQTATYIAGISGVSVGGDAVPVVIDSNSKLGTVVSSRRFKDDVKPMDNASDVIMGLKPVTFRYKKEIDPKGIPQFGLVAEDVEKINPDLVIRDREGKVNTVRYDAVNAMLLNEFLKEHRKVAEQQATITELKSTVAEQQKDLQATAAHQKKQIEALTVGLQKVSAQLEARKSAPQTVLNNQ